MQLLKSICSHQYGCVPAQQCSRRPVVSGACETRGDSMSRLNRRAHEDRAGIHLKSAWTFSSSFASPLTFSASAFTTTPLGST
jgi:hypothetical protein